MTAWPLNNTEYTAEAIGAWSGTRTRGVFSADDCFAVTSTGGFGIKVSPGLAWLKAAQWWGIAVLEQSDTDFTIDVGSGLLPRYVAVVLQYDKTANEVQLSLRYGEYESPAVKPQPVRDDYYDEIILASILQTAAAVEIAQADITDERLNEDMCGLMRDGVTGIPTAQLYAQWNAFFAQAQQNTANQQQQADEAFTTWFQRIQGVFAEDPAGNLQTQIDGLRPLITAATSQKHILNAPAAGWIEREDGSFLQSFDVEGITAETVICGDVYTVVEDGLSLDEKSEIASALGGIGSIKTSEGMITLLCFSGKPEMDLNIIVTEVR